MIPILLHLGPITIYSYGLMMALAFIVGDIVMTGEFKRRGFNPQDASTVILWVAIGGLAGARIYNIIDNWSDYMADPKAMIFSGAGFVFFGGLLGGVLTSWVMARRLRIPWLTLADMAAAPLILGHAIGRIGCFLSGDGDWGAVSNLPWAMSYPNAIAGWNNRTVFALGPHNQLVPIEPWNPAVRVHPAPLYETIMYVGVFFVLWSLRKKIHIEGRLFFLYLIMAGACRFLVEFIRVNPRVFMGLTEAQLISLGMIAVGTILWPWVGARQPALAVPSQAAQAS